MNNQEAKFILSAYRPNGNDANDEAFAEALQQAQRDPALGAWLASQQSFDAAMTGKIKEIPTPVGLREAILTGARVSGSTTRPAWTSRWWLGLGAAAAIAVVASIALWPKTAAADIRALTEFALKDTSGSRHGGHGSEVQAFQALLGDPQVRLSKALGIDFDSLRRDGCRTVGFDGREVLEICFNRNGAWYHLYAVRSEPESKEQSEELVTMIEEGNLCCATWSDPTAGVRFALVGNGGRDSLQDLL